MRTRGISKFTILTMDRHLSQILFCSCANKMETCLPIRCLLNQGKHLKENDRWKEKFLQEITSEFDCQTLTFENEKYRLIGVPFYNNEDENKFKTACFRH